MPIIDVHAHVTPERYKSAIAERGEWHGLGPAVGELHQGDFAAPLEQRLADMETLGADMQLLSPTIGFSRYEADAEVARKVARECNDEVAEMARERPDRFVGVGALPMQDLDYAIDELERSVRDLGLKGAIIRDHVVGRTYDEPEFLPFFRAAEDLGAVLFFHQGGGTLVDPRTKRYKLSNAIGNLTERTLTFATLVFGGVMDACPELKPLLAHAGGYTAFGVARLDKVAGAFEGGYPATGLEPPFPGSEDMTLTVPPSDYLGRFYYDSCTYDEQALQFLVDRVGADRVMLGTDYPAPMYFRDAVDTVQRMQTLSDEQKDMILSGNATRLLDL